MEKFSKWRDPSTGIQPFLPTSQPRLAPIVALSCAPLSAAFTAARALLLAVLLFVHVVLVDGACLILTPVPPLHRVASSVLTALTCRLALGLMGYYWITNEMLSPKKGSKNVAQIANTAPKKGDLIITNWTSYIDILYLAFRYNPTFLLPVFEPPTPPTQSATGRHTGTGSAQISITLPQPKFLGYMPISLLPLLARTGSLPPTFDVPPLGMYKTLRAARRAERGPCCLLPEGTTGNGKAVLRFGEGVLAEGDVGGDDEGVVWVKYFRHPSPTSFLSAGPCSLPDPLNHLLKLLYTPLPFPRSLHVRTLHPSSSPSSPSFLPSEILATAPGGLEGIGKDGSGAWREAVGVILAETGRARRVKGMGWVEKGGFLEYWEKSRKR